MAAVGYQQKKSTAFVTRSTIVWSWSQKREDNLKIKNYYYSLVYKELELLMLLKKKKVNQSNDWLLEGATIVQFLDFPFFLLPWALPSCISASRRAYVSYFSALEREC